MALPFPLAGGALQELARPRSAREEAGARPAQPVTAASGEAVAGTEAAAEAAVPAAEPKAAEAATEGAKAAGAGKAAKGSEREPTPLAASGTDSESAEPTSLQERRGNATTGKGSTTALPAGNPVTAAAARNADPE